MTNIETIINAAFENRANLTPDSVDPKIKDAIYQAIDLLDNGKLRVAEKRNGEWIVNQWLKKAVLLFFRINDNQIFSNGYTQYFDKVPMKDVDMSLPRIASNWCAHRAIYLRTQRQLYRTKTQS